MHESGSIYVVGGGGMLRTTNTKRTLSIVNYEDDLAGEIQNTTRHDAAKL